MSVAREGMVRILVVVKFLQLREIRGTACYVSAVMMDSHDGVISASYMDSRFIPHPGWNDRTSQRMQHHKQTV